MSVYTLHTPPCVSRLQATSASDGNPSAISRRAQAVWKLTNWLVGFLRFRSLRRARLLRLETLSEHRLRDLGFLDGRGVQLREPFRD